MTGYERECFLGASAFNQDIGDWNVSKVTNMRRMFFEATAFNQDMNDWNVSSVTDMYQMFYQATVFDGDISDWNVSKITSMNRMFYNAHAFNQDIGEWNVSSVTNMFEMFSNARAFNQDIGEWNVDSVNSMIQMFSNARAFNQDISGWNVSKVTKMFAMLSGSGLSTYHYEELLIGWNELDLQKRVTLGAGSKQYRVRAQPAHDSLTSTTNHNWKINDGGLKTENDTPVVVGISDLILLEGFASYGIPIDSLFTDPEGDTLKLTATTGGDMAIATTFLNDTLTLTELGIGVDTVYLTVNDIDKTVQVMDTFLVTVKNVAPRIVNPLADLILREGFGTHDIDISNTFEDEQLLMYSVNVDTVNVDTGGVLSAVVMGGTLTLTEIDTGSTKVIVTASDGLLETMDTFLVTTGNVAPRIANPLADLILDNGFGTHDLDISNAFKDEQLLMYSVNVDTVNVDTGGVLSAVVMGGTLTLTEIDTGSINVIITASDGLLETMDTFLVTIKNNSPRIVNPLADLILDNGFGTHDLDISNAFKDEQLLMYSVNVDTVNVDTGGVLSAVVIGNTLTLTEKDTGSINVIITASDGLLETMDTFLVTIKNNSPRIVNPLADLILDNGFGTHDLDIANTFEDEQLLMYSVNVDTGGVLSAVVIGNTLTLTEKDTGSTNVIITASDGVLQVMDTFLVTIKNNSPRIVNPLADLTLREGFVTHDLDIANTFEDEQSLIISVSGVTSSGVLSAAVSGNTLTLTEEGTGETNVIITASDGLLEVMDTFLVTIKNNSPRVANPLTDLTLREGFGTHDLDIANTFEDEQSLIISVSGVTSSGVLSAAVSGNTLTLTEEGTGSTNVIITASDGVLQVMDTFLVTIKNNSPRVANPLTDLTLREGFGTHDLDIANTFEDEQSLIISVSGVTSSGVLSAAVSGNTLTLTEEGTGSTNVIVTASDGVLQVMDTFLVTIKNNSPRVANPLADLILDNGFVTHGIDISNTFEDEQSLIISLNVATGGVLNAAVSGDMLTLTEIDTGATNVIITASDGVLQVMDTFLVTIKNNSPRVANPLADLILDNGFVTHGIDISNTFEDEQSLIISVNVATGGVLNAVVIGNTLTLTEINTGSTNVIITASDGVLQVMDTFLVTIKNNPPRVANPLTDLTLREGFGTHGIDISNTFEDQQSLMYSVNVAAGGVLNAAISGNTLTLTEVDTGSTNIIVTASDGVLQTTDTFLVTVKNAPPSIANPLADLILDNGFVTHDLDISNTFEDEQSLMYSVNVVSGGVLSAVVIGNTLTLTEINTGSTNVIITASDGVLETMDTFLVTIGNVAPRLVNALADLTLDNGFGTHDLDISNTFEDEQPLIISVNVVSGGVLSAVVIGNTLTLTEIDTGATNVIITASDGVLEVMDTFLVTIDNIAPRLVNALADLTLDNGFGTHDLDISNTFEDEQSLIISVNVAARGVLSAAISGNTLTLTEIDTGATNVIITASDGVLEVMDTFLVTISNIAPRLANALPDLTLDNGFGTRDLDISNTFEDEQSLIISVNVVSGGVLSAAISGNTLTLTEIDTGSTNVIITASDGVLETMDTFLVTIDNIAPRIANSLADLTLNRGFGTRDVDISNTFEDEQPLIISVNVVSGGVLSAVISGNTLTLTEIDTGSTNVIITASDGVLEVMDTFLVTIGNIAPRLANALPDLTLDNGFGTHDLDISNTFEDEQPLTYSVNVGTGGVLSAAISGNTLTLTEKDTGSTNVIITASDGVLETMDTFLVTIGNIAPRLANALADLTLNNGFGTHDLDISNTFEDEQPLMYSVNVGTGGVLSAAISGNTLTLTEIDTGSTNVIVTASDGVLETMDTFLVTIKNNPPRIANSLADLTLNSGFGTRDVDISNTFEDEQPLTYSVNVGTGGVLSAAISGNTLTLTEIDTGSTNVIVTASDGVLETMDTFLVTIDNIAPRIANPLADLTLREGFGTHGIDISNT